jgi:hypothetical protein
VVKSLNFLVLVIYLFSLQRLRLNAPKVMVIHLRSSSVSIEALWAKMDMLDETNRGGSFAVNIPWNAHHGRRSLPSVEKIGERASRTDKGGLLNNIPGPSNTQPRGHGRGFTKNKATQIWSAAPGLFPHACRGCLLIDSIHLRPVWIEVNGRLFWKSLLVWVTL